MRTRDGLPFALAILLACSGCGHGLQRAPTMPDSTRDALLRLQRGHDYFRLLDHLETREDRAGPWGLYLRAVRDVPPQSVEERRGATLQPGERGGVAVSIDSTPRRYAFDSGANFSVLVRSEAEGLGLEI
nr:hypothetical protein [Candidatus Palauibacterales bacterium]